MPNHNIVQNTISPNEVLFKDINHSFTTRVTLHSCTALLPENRNNTRSGLKHAPQHCHFELHFDDYPSPYSPAPSDLHMRRSLYQRVQQLTWKVLTKLVSKDFMPVHSLKFPRLWALQLQFIVILLKDACHQP